MKIEADRAHGRLEGCPFCAGGAGHGWLGLMEFMVGGGVTRRPGSGSVEQCRGWGWLELGRDTGGLCGEETGV